MELDKSAAIIEAILFTMGNAVELNTLMNVLDESPKELREQLRYLREKYAKPDSGISLIELEDSVQLCTKKEWYEYLIQVAKTPKKAVLTDALLETLSIIAYKQPITRLEIERIRGVNSDHAVSRLVEYGFVTDIGRMDAPGRPQKNFCGPLVFALWKSYPPWMRYRWKSSKKRRKTRSM